VRAATPYWDYFKPGPMEAWLQQVAAIREVLTAGGRTLTQGALAWLWARSAITIPIPGFKTAAQAEENAHSMAFGPLNDQQMREVDTCSTGRRKPEGEDQRAAVWAPMKLATLAARGMKPAPLAPPRRSQPCRPLEEPPRSMDRSNLPVDRLTTAATGGRRAAPASSAVLAPSEAPTKAIRLAPWARRAATAPATSSTIRLLASSACGQVDLP
jgi:hypothetical protein